MLGDWNLGAAPAVPGRGAKNLWDDREALAPPWLVYFEVALVEREYLPEAVPFGNANQGSVGKIHREIRVLPNQSTEARYIFRTEFGEDYETAIKHS
jgi:hypothetical protein